MGSHGRPIIAMMPLRSSQTTAAVLDRFAARESRTLQKRPWRVRRVAVTAWLSFLLDFAASRPATRPAGLPRHMAERTERPSGEL